MAGGRRVSRDKDGMETRRKKLNKDIVFPSIIVFTMLILLLFVCPFSPFYRYCFEPDEICYRIVSKGLLSGKIPYRDLFDHKGPLLYFIYALGMLITGGSSFGIWIVFALINSASFFFLYKSARLFFDPDVSFAGVMLSIAFLFFDRYTIFVSGSKPEHIVLLLLLASEYIFLRRIYSKREKPLEDIFTPKDMLLFGLLCGGVFVLKMNFCIYYLCFLGMYFLYQLFHKSFKSFFRNAAVFLGGIVAVCIPFMLFFAAHGALDDLIDTYFTFNTRYARTGGYELLYFRPWIQFDVKIAINIFFILGVLLFAGAFFKEKEKSPGRKQSIIYILLSFVIIGFITLPLIYRYALVTLLPLLAFGPCFLVSFLKEHFPKGRMPVLASVAATLLIGYYVVAISCIYPPIPKEKTALEVKMEAYSEQVPDATYLFYVCLCHYYFYDMTSEVPDFKYFYAPNFDKLPIIQQQAKLIETGVPDAVSFVRTPDLDDAFMESFEEFFRKCGYHLYAFDEEPVNERVYVFIRESQYEALTSNTIS